jgi:hypothetical protein
MKNSLKNSLIEELIMLCEVRGCLGEDTSTKTDLAKIGAAKTVELRIREIENQLKTLE